jgi:hypothetical protein
LREQTRNLSGSSDYRIALALLHHREVRRHCKTLVVAWTGVVVAAVGILVATAGIYSHFWMYQHPVSPASAISSPASQLGVK